MERQLTDGLAAVHQLHRLMILAGLHARRPLFRREAHDSSVLCLAGLDAGFEVAIVLSGHLQRGHAVQVTHD